MDQLLVGFVGVAAGILVAPGADFVIVVRNALCGRVFGLATAMGVTGGLVVHTALAVFGLSAVVASSPVLFTALTLAGGLYVLYLGVSTVWKCVWREYESTVFTESQPVGARPLRALRQGFLTNSLNPKAPILFLSLLPQFVPQGVPMVPRTILLGSIVIVVGLFWFSGVAATVTSASRILTRPRALKGIEVVSGVVLTVLGIAILVEYWF